MGIADVFFWAFITGIGALCGLFSIGATIFVSKIGAETLFFGAISAFLFYLSYIFWPFQMAMKVAS